MIGRLTQQALTTTQVIGKRNEWFNFPITGRKKNNDIAIGKNKTKQKTSYVFSAVLIYVC